MVSHDQSMYTPLSEQFLCVMITKIHTCEQQLINLVPFASSKEAVTKLHDPPLVGWLTK